MLEQFTVTQIYNFLIIFARVGSLFMLLPGLADVTVPARIRLLFAFAFSFVLLPVLQSIIPIPTISQPLQLMITVTTEIIAGVFLGMLTKIIISTLHTLGQVISTFSGLSSAMLFDPHQSTQTTLESHMLTMLALTLFFSMDLHHYTLKGLVDSYSLIPIDNLSYFEDMVSLFSKTLASSFEVAIKLGAAHIAMGIILFFSAGILVRLMPNLQIFYLLLPIQILLSFALLWIVLSYNMGWYLEYLREHLIGLLAP